MNLFDHIEAMLQAATLWHVVIFVSGGLLTKIAAQAYPKALDLLVKLLLPKRIFSLSGYWIGKFTIPSFNGVWTYEVYRVSQRLDEIKFGCFTFPSNAGARRSYWRGAGVVQQGIISAYYLNTDRGSYESGTLILEIAHQSMKGRFFQHDVRIEGKPLYISEYTYTLYKVRVPIMARMRMFVGISPFHDYKWPRAAYEKAMLAVAEPY
jgi:hypothetical protein